MKKLAYAAAVMALSGGSAIAADLPSRKEAPVNLPPSPPPMWTGFYAGLSAGWTGSNNANVWFQSFPVFANVAVAGPAAVSGAASAAAGASAAIPVKSNGFIGGGQLGYNWEFRSSFIAGIEADIQGVATSNQRTTAGTYVPIPPPAAAGFFWSSALTASRSIDYLGTVRGRLGYLIAPTVLAYGTGGLAYGGVNLSASIFQAPGGPANPGITGMLGAGSFSGTRVGWTAGGGVEWMFLPNWSAKVEYLYYNLGSATTPSIPLSSINTLFGGTLFNTNTVQARAHFDGNVVRAGVNYHFNWGSAPVVAKY